MILRKLHVVFHSGGLMSGRHAPIHPVRLVENMARVRHLIERQYFRDR